MISSVRIIGAVFDMPNSNDDYYGYSPYKLAYEHPSIHGLFVIIRGRANITDKATGKAKGYCTTSIGGFAKEMNITKRTVINWIKTLEKEKYIHIISTGRGKVNKIYPLWNYSNVSTTSDTDDTSKAVFSGETDCTSKDTTTSDTNNTSSKNDTSNKDDTSKR